MLDTLFYGSDDVCFSLSSGVASGWDQASFAEDPDSTHADGSPECVDSPASSPLAALAGSALARRFSAWNGASGMRYIWSVFALDDCPAFADAVVLAVRSGWGDAREIVAAADTGPMPEHMIGGALLDFVRGCGANEWHVHLLCESPAARSAIVADLTKGC